MATAMDDSDSDGRRATDGRRVMDEQGAMDGRWMTGDERTTDGVTDDGWTGGRRAMNDGWMTGNGLRAMDGR